MSYSNTIIFLLVLLVFNAFFSIAEFSIASSRKFKLEQMIKAGSENASLVLFLSENPNKFITVIQIGLNVIAILSGIFGEQTFAPVLSKLLVGIGLSEKISEIISICAIVLSITAVFILFAELIPKKLAYSKPEEIACKVVKPLFFCLDVFKPVVFVLSFLSDKILKIFNVDTKRDETVTYDEVSALITHGAETGLIEEKEHHLIENVFSLTDRNVTSAMTPKKDIIFFDVNDESEVIREKFLKHPHSRFLVADTSLDNLFGYVESMNILKNLFIGKAVVFNRDQLNEYGLKAALTIPDTLTLLDVLDKFRESRQDIAVIINEFGMVVGLITLNDVLATLMGNVVAPMADGQLIVKRAENSWLIDGKVAFEDVKKLFDWDDVPVQEGFETINGFLMYKMKSIPKKAQKYEYKNVIFEVVDVEGYRIDEVMATIKEKK
jgi:CBS domain containing-hemolysin-like protein